ncbi:hypothetical protein [Sphingobium psychrophilum]|nr:hypothetical protein [Sphingobium psychrophilum]
MTKPLCPPAPPVKRIWRLAAQSATSTLVGAGRAGVWESHG